PLGSVAAFLVSRGVNCCPQSRRRQRIRGYLVVVNKKNRRLIHTERCSALSVSNYPSVDLLAIHVFFEAFHIESGRFCEVFESFSHIRCTGPNKSIVVKQIVHFPKMALQSGGFGCTRSV